MLSKKILSSVTNTRNLMLLAGRNSSRYFSTNTTAPQAPPFQTNQTKPSYNANASLNNKQQQSLLHDDRFYNEEKFTGISQESFSKEINDILLGELDNGDIEIKPDGIIYLPEIKYRRILNQAFGPGGWALKPFGPPVVIDGSLIRPYALHCLGRFVSESFGEQPYVEGGFLSFATANEAAKSNALVRCCKDLGIGSSLWDPIFIRNWKQQYAEEKFYVNTKTNDKKKFWTLKNGSNPIGYPWKESNTYQDNQQLQQQSSYKKPEVQQQSEEPTVTSQFNPNQIPINQVDDTLPVTSTTATSTSNTDDYVNTEEIDIDSVVPPQLKKYAGKTWREVIQDPRGVQYIGWASKEMKGRVQLQAKAIYDFVVQHQQQQQQQ